MFEFILNPNNAPFTIALFLMLGIALLEGITVIFGAGFSSFLDTLVPEIELDIDSPNLSSQSPGLNMDSPEINAPNILTRLLGWLRVGKVPVLMLLVIFLTAFGLIGLTLQAVLSNALGIMLPPLLAALAVFFLSLPCVSISAEGLSRILPKDETDAVSEKSFIGRVAVITLGTANKGNPAQAKLTDENGQSHYVMVEPDTEADEFTMGDSVILIKQNSSTFIAIHNSNPNLID